MYSLTLYNHIIEAHGIIGCLAWVIFFPLGSVAIRLLHTSKAWLVHATIQTLAYMMVITNSGMGIWIAIVSDQLDNYHAKTGLSLLALTSLEPIIGLLHHRLFAKQRPSSIVGQTHVWLGRTIITLGMINGGLGMLLGRGPTCSEQIAYGVVAGTVWLAWIAIDVFTSIYRKPADVAKSEHELRMETGWSQKEEGDSNQL